jgi:hypothetical protein
MSPKLPLPDDRVYAVIGALGTQTGNATYVGLGLSSSVTQLGFASIDDDTLKDTANEYTAVPNPDLFFLQYFARDCEGLETLTKGSHCYSIGDQLPDCPDPKDLKCARLGLTLRNYLFPSSQRGPAPEYTLNPLVITLQRPRETEQGVVHEPWPTAAEKKSLASITSFRREQPCKSQDVTLPNWLAWPALAQRSLP